MQSPQTPPAPLPTEEGDAFVVELTGAQLNLYCYLQSLIPNSADTRDVLQETNLALWAKRKEYNPARPFWPWACQFAKYQALAYSKRRSHDKLQFGSELLELLAEQAETQGGQFEEELSVLQQCLKKINQKSLQLLQLRYRQALSCQELARQLGRKPSAVRVALFRVRSAVADCIRKSLAAQGESNS